ncbi:hypothetical protein [Kriegella aquimaris]|uniref:Uncharacterized protein n=1 Tax=Kriegella aquimaris TaxID=192904 RepID=A0A1G9UN46_9FLAO|nr:hypothetical protein [Kriegella aquimaris]SDM61338.1 hypothetical protein SAMN04488514_11199 [Kriegella aquimaris]
MNTKNSDKKETELDTEFVKEENQKTRNYIFQKNTITKSGALIIAILLILVVIGIVVSGVFFEAPTENP